MRMVFICALAASVAAGPARAAEPAARSTRWELQASLGYDTLCALNVLSGDPYYLEDYRSDYARLAPRLTDAEKAELVAVKRIIKDEGKGIVSAALALVLSVERVDSLGDLLSALDRPAEIRERFSKTEYWDAESFETFLRARPHVVAAVRALQRIGFEADWARTVRPLVEARIQELRPTLLKYDVIPRVEAVLGHPLPSDAITVYLLYYSKPHGIRVTGTRYLTHFSYPFGIVLHNAVHEMLHPPYDLAGDPQVRPVIEELRKSAFLVDKVKHHDPSLGYNELEGFVEEDCVQALEQAITRHLGLKDDLRTYWRRQDGGMHVLAVALYQLIQRHGFLAAHEPFPRFLARLSQAGELSNDRLVALNGEFFAGN